MKIFSGIKFWSVLLLLGLATMTTSCSNKEQPVQTPPLWINVQGEGSPTIVFISGNGNDSSAWAGVEEQIRDLGVQTVLYDRAGLGQSALSEAPYSLDQEINDLAVSLGALQVRTPRILVAHSYGGLIATGLATIDSDVEGIVLVDALIGAELSDDLVAGVLDEYVPQFDTIREAAPDLAKAVIPVIEAYPDTAKYMQAIQLDPDLPVINILAGKSLYSRPEDTAHHDRVHKAFVEASAARTVISATDSGHNIMRDDPELVIAAVSEMIDRIQ